MNTSPLDSSVAKRILLTGRVQGVGLRPAIARRAVDWGLAGWVRNTNSGVEVHIEGNSEQIFGFLENIADKFPLSSSVDNIVSQNVLPRKLSHFEVLVSDDSGALATPLPQDRVACELCMSEFVESSNRRANYPFIACADCGPRYSLIEVMPFERNQTTMRGFSLCHFCQYEFDTAENRRFHTQIIACGTCGPILEQTLESALATIRDGRIVAMKGLGGYQLLCDAADNESVERLRMRKGRQTKPLAVMISSLKDAEQFAMLTEFEYRLLKSPAGPIVILPLKSDRLARAISPGLSSVGLMLPTTPLHFALVRSAGPLVVTSGNFEGEPLAYENAAAEMELSEIADNFLHHNRPIRRAIDDSVVRVVAGQQITIRLARGLAPLSLELDCIDQILATGGHQKSSVALTNGKQAILGPHIGDLDSVASRQRFDKHIHDLLTLYRSQPNVIVHDHHPDYFTTRWAETFASKHSLRCIGVQHHHAHVVAGMIEPKWLERRVLGVAWDGTGYGTDGSIWGGEFLQATSYGFERIGHLRHFCLPGGQTAIHQPWRIAAAMLRQVRAFDPGLKFQMPVERKLPDVIFEDSRLSPTTSSAGRLFDAVAAMLLPNAMKESAIADYEGHFASLLENLCDRSATGSYPFDWHRPCAEQPTQLDWRPLIAALFRDIAAGVPAPVLAMRFHRSLASAIYEFCNSRRDLPVVLCGGVFQNQILLELLIDLLEASSIEFTIAETIPINDGGLAAGQLAIALAMLRRERSLCV